MMKRIALPLVLALSSPSHAAELYEAYGFTIDILYNTQVTPVLYNTIQKVYVPGPLVAGDLLSTSMGVDATGSRDVIHFGTGIFYSETDPQWSYFYSDPELGPLDIASTNCGKIVRGCSTSKHYVLRMLADYPNGVWVFTYARSTHPFAASGDKIRLIRGHLQVLKQ